MTSVPPAIPLKPPVAPPQLQDFPHTQFIVRKKMFKLLGGAFHVYGPDESTVLAYCEMKAFKLKEDIRVFADVAKQRPLLNIKARSILDFGATYDLTDPQTNQKIGALRRKGLKSMFRDEWVLLSPTDQEIGLIQEDSTGLALLRRFIDVVSYFIPQQYNVTLLGKVVASMKQNKNPFVTKIRVTRSVDVPNQSEGWLMLAAALLLCAIEGKQQG